jgi:hypothetical protein
MRTTNFDKKSKMKKSENIKNVWKWLFLNFEVWQV